jgi:dihydroneopterin aldolase
MDKIFIKGLALEAKIGIYEHEKGVTQPITIDLDIFFDSTKAAASGLIEDTIDYDVVAQTIANIVTQTRFELLESLAEAVTTKLLSDFKMNQLVCTIFKPQALNNAETAGISIVRPLKA